MPTEYYIVQMMPDVFRREPRNVGVVVLAENRLAARFLGETDSGEIDGRKIRSLPEPNVYRQWVSYWRRTLNKGGLEALLRPRKRPGHFSIIRGGSVTDTGRDSPSAVADYLYSLLVSEGGFAEAISGGRPPEVNATLNEELDAAFLRAQILEDARAQISAFARHPIQRRVEVRGHSRAPYHPPFYQSNGATYVIETADLESRQRNRVREHAGHAAYMFSDLRREYGDDLLAIAVIHGGSDEASRDEAAEFTVTVLASEANQVVRWDDPVEREQFLAERQRVATD